MSSLMGMLIPGILGPLFDTGFNWFQQERANQIQEERAGKAMGMIDELQNNTLADRDTMMAKDLYEGNFDPSKYGADQFKSSTNFGNVLDSMLGDIQGSQNRANNWIRGGMQDPNAQAGEVGKFVTDVGTDAYLQNAARSATGASNARMAQGRQDILGNILSRGGSLAESRDAFRQLGYGEDIARSNEIAGAEASAEGMRNANMQARANLQGQTYNNVLGQNAAFGQLGAGLEQKWAEQRNQARGGMAGMQASFEQSAQDRAYRAYQDMLQTAAARTGYSNDLMKWYRDQDTNTTLAKAGIQTGIPLLVPQSSAGQQIASNVTGAMQAYAAMHPKQTSSWSFLGIGGSSGCIACDSLVDTERGIKAIADILPGDRVRGADNKFHAVVGKDCGVVPEEHQHQMVEIQTAPMNLYATPDHIIDGRPAGQWKHDDLITVDGAPTRVEYVKAVPYWVSGDLMLEGNVPYLANGFVVHSMIGRNGLDAWRNQILSGDGETREGWTVSKANELGVWAKGV